MLDGYKDGQPVVYSMLMNAINNGKLSHAYIFDSNGNSDVFDIVLLFVKMILCKDIDDENEKSVICKRVDDGNYLDVKVIEPDGIWIKKRIFWTLTPRSMSSQVQLFPFFERNGSPHRILPFQHTGLAQWLLTESCLCFQQVCICPSWPVLWLCISSCRTRLHERL